MTDISKLRARRETLKNKLAALDARIIKIEREQQEAEHRELLKIIKSRGLTVAQLQQMLGVADKSERD